MPAKTLRQPTGGIALDLSWSIVWIDQEPFRRSAADACRVAMMQLEEARAGWHRFEREDKPAFNRWRAREFGPLLSKAREVEVEIREKQALIHEVEMEMRRGFQDAATAYRRVKARRENSPEPIEEAPPPREQSSYRPMSDFEKETLFQEWVRKSLGTNPDIMDDAAYAESFEAFKTHMFRPPKVETPRSSYRKAPLPRPELEEELVEDNVPPVDARVKELYRRLVRRLHPDLRRDRQLPVSALWHEVQEAYQASDIARLELLLALSEIQSNHMSDATSLGQMQAVMRELERAITALEKSLLEAEREDAWNFARVGADADLRLRVERQLKHDFAIRSQRLELLTQTIAIWAAGPVANRQVMRGQAW